MVYKELVPTLPRGNAYGTEVVERDMRSHGGPWEEGSISNGRARGFYYLPI